MKIFYRNLKQGVVKLRVGNLDDLWYLSTILKEGDLVRGKTKRRIKAQEDVMRGKSTQETVTLGIKVEKIDFSQRKLRVSGKIQQGPEDLISLGSYHTFNVRKGTILKIKKEKWSPTELQRLKEAEKAALRAKILILVVEEGEATLGLLQESKIKYYDLSKAIGGKYTSLKGREDRKKEFYTEIEKFIARTLDKEDISGIIVAGPGFEPENFYKFFLEKYPNLEEKTFLEKINSGGRSGVKEVVRRPVMKKISQELGSAREIEEVNGLLKEIGKDSGLGIYGLKEVKNAAKIGAIEKLLICDDFFIENRDGGEKVIQEVRNKGGKFHFINHEGEAGQQLSSLGGIAAILRFKIK